jgi:hypothetical protein
LGFSNWPVIYYTFPRNLGRRSFCRRYHALKKKLSHHHHRATNKFSGVVAREERRLLQGEFRTHILYFVLSFALLYFLLASFYQKTQKKNRILDSCFYLLAFSLVRMSNPEVEVRTFKQQGGDSLKDAWYRISNSHHRCTKKHSTMILLKKKLCWYN